jgi:hypothetical protein
MLRASLWGFAEPTVDFKGVKPPLHRRPLSSFPFVSRGASLLPQASGGAPAIRPYGVTWNSAHENTVGRIDVPRHYRRPEISQWPQWRFWPQSGKSQGLGDRVPNSRNDAFRPCWEGGPSQPIGVILGGRPR